MSESWESFRGSDCTIVRVGGVRVKQAFSRGAGSGVTW
jgi:hypothetical protein